MSYEDVVLSSGEYLIGVKLSFDSFSQCYGYDIACRNFPTIKKSFTQFGKSIIDEKDILNSIVNLEKFIIERNKQRKYPFPINYIFCSRKIPRFNDHLSRRSEEIPIILENIIIEEYPEILTYFNFEKLKIDSLNVGFSLREIENFSSKEITVYPGNNIVSVLQAEKPIYQVWKTVEDAYEYISKLEVSNVKAAIFSDINIIIAGDEVLSRSTLYGERLIDFCKHNTFIIIESHLAKMLPNELSGINTTFYDGSPLVLFNTGSLLIDLFLSSSNEVQSTITFIPEEIPLMLTSEIVGEISPTISKSDAVSLVENEEENISG